jgi:transposase-like protein
MNAIPHREQKEVAAELAGIWKQERKEDALLNLAAFKAKYHQRYPEAGRSLMEDEEHLLTFYALHVTRGGVRPQGPRPYELPNNPGKIVVNIINRVNTVMTIVVIHAIVFKMRPFT